MPAHVWKPEFTPAAKRVRSLDAHLDPLQMLARHGGAIASYGKSAVTAAIGVGMSMSLKRVDPLPGQDYQRHETRLFAATPLAPPFLLEVAPVGG